MIKYLNELYLLKISINKSGENKNIKKAQI